MEKSLDDSLHISNNYFDHVYCNSSELKSSSNVKHVLTENNHTHRTDAMALLEENKRLNAMLVLHLDLIQEQNNQLISNNKQLVNLNEEVEQLRCRSTQLEARVQELQKQVQLQIKRAAVGDSDLSTMRLPPLAKIQTKSSNSPAANFSAATTTTKTTIKNFTPVKDTDGIPERYNVGLSKMVIHRNRNMPLQSTHGRNQPDENMTYEFSEDPDHSMGHDNDNEDEIMSNSTDDSTDCAGSDYLNSKSDRKSSLDSPKQNYKKKCAFKDPRTPNRGKEMSLVMWHALDTQREERGNCESLDSTEFASSGETNSVFGRNSKADKCKGSAAQLHTLHSKLRRCAYFYSPHMYYTREWEGKSLTYDYEFVKEEFNQLNMDSPNLEIPKWTEHELPHVQHGGATPTAAEDVADETYFKRHTKFETDEKRRKKWDVQQIREQRRIEKLKRRHCKDELLSATEQAPLFQSFYPQAAKVQMICFINELPVQAFGEAIPKLMPGVEFRLPWLGDESASTSAETNTNCALLSEAIGGGGHHSATPNSGGSSFVYLKKRRRQALIAGSSGRQRNTPAAAHKANLANFATSEAARNLDGKSLISTGDNSMDKD